MQIIGSAVSYGCAYDHLFHDETFTCPYPIEMLLAVRDVINLTLEQRGKETEPLSSELLQGD